MKKLIMTLLSAATALSLQAQNINPNGDHERQNIDEPKAPVYTDSLSGWCIDGNLMVGVLNQMYTANSPVAGYNNLLRSSTSSMSFDRGMSYGIEAQAGYFFDKKRHWGIGLGLAYFYQQGTVSMDRFQATYAAYDKFNNIFRQEVRSNGDIKERLSVSSFNVPIVAKYQTRFSKRVGFTADAGLLLNLTTRTTYRADASFDYEAIYKYVGNEGNITTVYDNSVTPGATDLLITKAQYLGEQPNGDIQAYFNNLRSQGYNVGLGVAPRDNKGTVTYNNGSIGVIVRPAVSIYLRSNLTLNLGLYYYYQNIGNEPVSNYHITDKVGQYSSMLNTTSKVQNHSYGINVGIRYSFKKKQANTTPEVAAAPEVPEQDEEVAKPVEVEEVETVNISTPLLFDLDKVIIKESSIPILEEAARQLKTNPGASLVIHGYTDNTGSAGYNKKLSQKRAAVVKNYLRKKGVNERTLKTVAHGEGNPAGNNRTKEGRMKNRRVIMKMKD